MTELSASLVLMSSARPMVRSLLVAAICLVAPRLAAIDRSPAVEVSNFALLDQQGEMHELRRENARAVVLFFTANGCPVARQTVAKLAALREKFSGQGVSLYLVNSSTGDDRVSIQKEMTELQFPNLPVLKDDTQGVARHLAVGRTGEAVAISTKSWRVFYRGAVDDQAAEGAQRPAPAERYLENALEAFLAERDIPVASIAARGCRIMFDGGNASDAEPVSYQQQVAPILGAKCISCHSAGNIGSWNMSSHRKVKSMAAMIEEVILARRMPPWDADPAHGKFRNVPALTLDEAKTLLRWVHQGAPRDEGPDPLEARHAEARKPRAAWPLGEPDVILRLPQPERIPATGVVEYRNIEVPVGNPQAEWAGAVYIKPGNLKVVHHVVLRLKDEATGAVSALKVFATWSPGMTRVPFPENAGKYIPARARFDVEMHYTTNGAPQSDQTEVGLYWLKSKPARTYETIGVLNPTFSIRPGDPDSRVHAEYAFTQDVLLHSVKPHMHVRGKSMKFELLYPDGRREVVASVPRYDFNWQLVYELEAPRQIPAGTWALLTGSFDNSPRNPHNPAPGSWVHWGKQTFEEMFIGWFNVTRPVDSIDVALK